MKNSDEIQSIDEPNTPATTGSLNKRPWMAWLSIAFAVFVLFAFVAVSGKVFQADTEGENDAGVAHPQPVGVDDDVAR